MTFHPSEVVREYAERFPESPAKTLARRIIKDNPRLYRNLECCYSAVRRVFGVAGASNRSSQVSSEAKKLRRKPREAGWQAGIPNGLTHHTAWAPYEIEGRPNVLILSDIHAPYHCKKSLTQAIQYGVDAKVNTVILNGDICDFYAGSKFLTDPRKRNLIAELEAVKSILGSIRKALPKARMIFKKGNHEERWFRYIATSSPELLDLAQLSVESLLDMPKYGIECIPDRRPIHVADYTIIHGHELGNMYSNPVGPARAYWMRTMCNTIAGHLHRTNEYSALDLNRNLTRVYTAGCLCELRPDYAPMNGWNNGFIHLVTKKSGKANITNIRNEDL